MGRHRLAQEQGKRCLLATLSLLPTLVIAAGIAESSIKKFIIIIIIIA
jgi:hypothetical protein